MEYEVDIYNYILIRVKGKCGVIINKDGTSQYSLHNISSIARLTHTK